MFHASISSSVWIAIAAGSPAFVWIQSLEGLWSEQVVWVHFQS